MPYDITVNTTFGAAPPPPPPPPPGGTGDFAPMTFASPTAPTRAEVEQLARERWHTRPDWWIAGTTPKDLISNVADLPAGMSYDAGSNVVTVSGNIALLDGWDFAKTGTQIKWQDGGVHGTISNCTFAPSGAPKANRLDYLNDANGFSGSRTVWDWNNDSSIYWERIYRCQFTASPDYDGGAFTGTAIINGNSPGNSKFPIFNLMEFCSFEAYGMDGIKASIGGTVRYCYFDCATAVPEDAEEYVPGKTYNRNDVVWTKTTRAQDRWVCICTQNGTTIAPPTGGPGSSNSSWRTMDPHCDPIQQGQSPASGLEIYGCFFNADQDRRRYPDKGKTIRVSSNLIRANTFGSGNRQGGKHLHHNICTYENELKFSGQDAVSITSSDAVLWPGTSHLIEYNDYDCKSGDIVGGTSSSVPRMTIQFNRPNWNWWAPAVLSNLSVGYAGGDVTVNLTSNLGGYAIVLVSTSATPMTATEITKAKNDPNVLARFEVDCAPGVARQGTHVVALPAGTYYAHLVFNAGGVDTVAPVRTLVV